MWSMGHSFVRPNNTNSRLWKCENCGINVVSVERPDRDRKYAYGDMWKGSRYYTCEEAIVNQVTSQ